MYIIIKNIQIMNKSIHIENNVETFLIESRDRCSHCGYGSISFKIVHIIGNDYCNIEKSEEPCMSESETEDETYTIKFNEIDDAAKIIRKLVYDNKMREAIINAIKYFVNKQ